MPKDRQIKKRISEEIERVPTKSFEAFCAENDIAVQTPQKRKRAAFAWKRWAFPLAAVAAALCVILPVTLTRGNGGGGDGGNVGKQYNVGREITKPVEFEELERDPDLVLYDTDYERSNAYSAMLYSEDDGVLLAYVVKSVIYGGQVDGALQAYQFDFLARCYDGYAETYSFVLDWYENNGTGYSMDSVDYYYGIVNGEDGVSAVVCYENGKYDYFIKLRLLNVGQTINNESVESFIELAFGDKQGE